VTFEAADIRPDLADYTDSVSDAVDLKVCTPSLTVLAQAPWRSFGTGGESLEDTDLEDDDLEAAIAEMVVVTFATAVYRSAADADEALEALADTIGAGEVTSICQADQAQGAGDADANPKVEPTAVDMDVADEHVAFELVDSGGEPEEAGDGRPLVLLARNGPALTVLGGFAGPDGDLESLLRAVATEIDDRVDAELAAQG